MKKLMCDTVENRAYRLKQLRMLSHLSRDKIKDRYGVPSGTIQNWENGRSNGLTKKGAVTMIKVFQAEGILCDFNWLYYGVGLQPIAKSSIQNIEHNANTINYCQEDYSQAALETENFLQLHENSTSYFNNNNSYLPL